MDRQEAIEFLKAEGFFVTERQWSLGDSICVAALPQQNGDVRSYGVMLYLYPDGSAWRVLNPMSGRGDDSGFDTLAEAVSFASDVIRQEVKRASA